jgi:hypothetical protein
MAMVGAYSRNLGLVACAALFLAGCSDTNRQSFDGVMFRASLDADKEDARNFVVEVRDPGQSLSGAREAGRYEAVQHCIKKFGNSRMTWAQGPDSEADDLRFEDGDLILTGQCAGW